MHPKYPKYFYKYRSIDNISELGADHSIKGLFHNQAVFSNRINFNDLFDSKIELVKPTAEELEKLNNMFEKLRFNSVDGCLSNGEIIPDGNDFTEGLIKEFNSLVDRYPFYCVSKTATNNLMWSHYADSHKGFCIEFKSEYMKADKVSYQENIPKINIMDLVRLKLNPSEDGVLRRIWAALRTKLNEWKYEEEYRFQANNSMQGGKVPEGEKFIIIPYGPEFVESVIFGCRMPEKMKEYITNNMPEKMKFKQAVERTSSIEIVDSNFSVVS